MKSNSRSERRWQGPLSNRQMPKPTPEQLYIQEGLVGMYGRKKEIGALAIGGFTGTGKKALAEALVPLFAAKGIEALIYDPAWRMDTGALQERMDATGLPARYLALLPDMIDYGAVNADLATLRAGEPLEIKAAYDFKTGQIGPKTIGALAPDGVIIAHDTYVGELVGSVDAVALLYTDTTPFPRIRRDLGDVRFDPCVDLTNELYARQSMHFKTHFESLRELGMRFVPIDYSNPKKPQVMDTHAPFMDAAELVVR